MVFAGHLDLTQPLVWTVDDALDADACGHYAGKMTRGAEVAPVITEHGVEVDLSVRNNTRVMWDDAAEANALLARVASSVPHLLSGQRLVGANPRLRRNKIHDGKQAGVYVYDSGLGTVEDNDITGNALTGVEIKTGANPTLRRNRINRNKQAAVRIYQGKDLSLVNSVVPGTGWMDTGSNFRQPLQPLKDAFSKLRRALPDIFLHDRRGTKRKQSNDRPYFQPMRRAIR